VRILTGATKGEPPISTCFRAEVMRPDILVEIDAVAWIRDAAA
jgi:enamine deaminase RidA (YjgF/YER057c/UK114 family)